jgi:hypothetical protein
MKPFRLILAAGVLAAAVACNGHSVTAPDRPRTTHKPTADQSTPPPTTSSTPPAPVPADTTGKGQGLGSGT